MLYPLSYRPARVYRVSDVTATARALQSGRTRFRSRQGPFSDSPKATAILRPLNMYAVISDIHGNLEGLEAVLADLPEAVETVYCLGDVIGYGANPDECCDVVRETGMPTITGNHDLAVTDLSTDLNWFNPVAAAAVMWTREHLSERNAQFLLSRPRTMQSREALFVHGSVRNPDEYIINSISAEENLEVLRREYPEVPICFFGHTHVKTIAPSPNGRVTNDHIIDLGKNGPYLVNPGSVGQPRDGDTFASYVIAEGTRLTYRFVEYDIEKAQAKIRAAGLPGMLADRLAVGR